MKPKDGLYSVPILVKFYVNHVNLHDKTYKCLHSSKMKALADDNFEIDEIDESFPNG